MVHYESHYLTMRDGVRLAVDVWLPQTQYHPAATIVRQTRYFRSVGLRWPWRWLMGNRPLDHSGLYARRRKRFLQAGYAWIDVDTRGSGASFGHRISPWSQAEVADGYEVVDWIVKQSWSDGNVGALGISYDGTAAEMLLTTGHPAIKAIAPRFCSCDSFADIGFPGGLKNLGFIRRWGQMNSALDANRLQDIVGPLVIPLTSGVTAVSSDAGGRLRAAAIKDHTDNYDVLQRVGQLQFADDEPRDTLLEIREIFDEFGNRLRGSQLISPSSYAKPICDSAVPIYSISGWWDGAYARTAALRFLRTPNPGSRLLLGPWNHGGGRQIEPGLRSHANRFDHDGRLLQFFDLHCRQRMNSLADEPPVQYFTMNQSAWKWSEQWPPSGARTETLFLTQLKKLRFEPELVESHSMYDKQPTTTGSTNRWQTQVEINGQVQYPDRREVCRKMLCFQSEPLSRNREVTGHPVATLHVNCNAEDGTILVYLEDVDPAGRVWLVSEGGLNLRHRMERNDSPSRQSNACRALGIPYRTHCREDAAPMPVTVDGRQINHHAIQAVRIEVLPTSYLFRAGHRIQLSIAMSDVGNFEETTASQLYLSHSPEFASKLDLPILDLSI